MPMFNSFPQQLPYGLDQSSADPQLPADSPLERLSRLILSGQLPDEMRPHVVKVLQGIRQDIANQASASGYGGAGSRLGAPAADPPSLPSWGSLAPSAANDDDYSLGPKRTAFGDPERFPMGSWQERDTGQVDEFPIDRVASTRLWPVPGFGPIPPAWVPGTPENREWTNNATRGIPGLIDAFRRLGWGASSGPSEPEDCDSRFQREMEYCGRRNRLGRFKHPDYRRACETWANDRRELCQKYGYDYPAPSEWGPADEEQWFNRN